MSAQSSSKETNPARPTWGTGFSADAPYSIWLVIKHPELMTAEQLAAAIPRMGEAIKEAHAHVLAGLKKYEPAAPAKEPETPAD